MRQRRRQEGRGAGEDERCQHLAPRKISHVTRTGHNFTVSQLELNQPTGVGVSPLGSRLQKVSRILLSTTGVSDTVRLNVYTLPKHCAVSFDSILCVREPGPTDDKTYTQRPTRSGAIRRQATRPQSTLPQTSEPHWHCVLKLVATRKLHWAAALQGFRGERGATRTTKRRTRHAHTARPAHRSSARR